MADALAWHKQGLDFTDALHLANFSAQDAFVTFDKALITKAQRLNLTPKVQAP